MDLSLFNWPVCEKTIGHFQQMFSNELLFVMPNIINATKDSFEEYACC